MSVHFRNVSDVLAILRDVYAYIAITHQNKNLGMKIMDRIEVILKDNDEEHPKDNDGYDEIILKKLLDRKTKKE